MSSKEAINFVYHGDSTRLYCTELILEESEKIVGEINTLLLPQKCFRINTEQYYLIGYTSYQCYSVMDNITWDMIEISLNMIVVDKHYNIQDSMVVYKGNDFYSGIKGLLNPVNGKIFLLREKHGYLYIINPQKLKFELIKDQDNVVGATDDLSKVIDRLEWKEDFMK
jgi:hypothetical protein